MTDFDNLAKLIKEAAKVREESYQPSSMIHEGFEISTGSYSLTIWDACEKVVKEMGLGQQYSTLANLLLFPNWNDALDWADRQLHPVEMAYVEGCYRIANALNFGDGAFAEIDSAEKLSKEFCESAESVRKSLYSFGH